MEIRITGKVTEEDYKRLLPDLQRVIAGHGELNLLCKFDGFTGVEAEALWEDMKFYAGNVGDIRRCAVVKDQEWQGVVSRLGSLFGIEIRVVDASEEDEAWEWLLSGVEAEAAGPRDERDRWHARAVQNRLDWLVKNLRANVEQSEDPQAEALFETSAEVLIGLRTAFEHFMEQSKEAWRD